MPAVVRLVNAAFYAHHGVMQEEHAIGGRFEVDVAVGLDPGRFAQAAQDDALDQTVDYERLYTLAKRTVLENRFYLIERLAFLIATGAHELYPGALWVEVTVRKPNPPVGGTTDRAEVTYRTGE
jgi:dihydroneopterin aldolase